MGADDGDDDERPVHPVFLDPYYISVHPITSRHYAAFLRSTGHHPPVVRELPRIVKPADEGWFRELATPYEWADANPPNGREEHPVALVGYQDAMAYCTWLSHEIGQRVRLPTEAEWERAARGGLERRRYPWGDDIDPSRANYLQDPALKHQHGTTPVGSFPANGLGLFDMCGNVWEWVADWYGAHSYRDSERRNPQGPPPGSLRIVRGGAWVTSDEAQLRCAHRQRVPADTYTYSIGFRVVYSEPPE
jgi:sulfatase modifying factor 1